MPAILLDALAFLCLIIATIPGGGNFRPEAIPWLLAAGVLLVVAARAKVVDRSHSTPSLPPLFGPLAVVVVLLFGLGSTLSTRGFASDRQLVLLILQLCALGLAIEQFWLRGDTSPRLGMVGLFALGLTIRLVAIATVPDPHIDVFDCHNAGIDQLVHGRNPYGETMPSGNSLAYGYEMRGYPYPPLTLLLLLPMKFLFGDVRYGMVAIEFAALVAFWLTLRKRTAMAQSLESLLLCFYLQPHAGTVAWKAWTEPLVVAALALVIVFNSGWAIGAAIAIKQYMFPWAALLLTGPKLNVRRLLAAGACLAVTTLPFVLVAPARFFQSIGLSRLAYRPDSLSLNRTIDYFFGWHMDVLLAPKLVGLLWLTILLWAWQRRWLHSGAFIWRLNALAAFTAQMFGYAFLNNFYYLQALVLFVIVNESLTASSRTPDLAGRPLD